MSANAFSRVRGSRSEYGIKEAVTRSRGHPQECSNPGIRYAFARQQDNPAASVAASSICAEGKDFVERVRRHRPASRNITEDRMTLLTRAWRWIGNRLERASAEHTDYLITSVEDHGDHWGVNFDDDAVGVTIERKDFDPGVPANLKPKAGDTLRWYGVSVPGMQAYGFDLNGRRLYFRSRAERRELAKRRSRELAERPASPATED
jgi:hypothetical protein